MNKTIKLQEAQLTNMVKKAVNKVMLEERRKRAINENAELLSVLGGMFGVGAVSYGIAEAMDALEQGKLGDSGVKLAKFLNDLGRAATRGE